MRALVVRSDKLRISVQIRITLMGDILIQRLGASLDPLLQKKLGSQLNYLKYSCNLDWIAELQHLQVAQILDFNFINSQQFGKVYIDLYSDYFAYKLSNLRLKNRKIVTIFDRR